MVPFIQGASAIGLFVGVLYFSEASFEKLSLKREELKNVVVDRLPSCVLNKTNKKISLDLVDKEFRIYVKIFLDELSQKSNLKLDNFRENFHPDCFVRKYMSKFNYQGLYDFGSNTITIFSKEINEYLYHELLHMASANKNIPLSDSIGFQLRIRNKLHGSKLFIGKGLNEGYTELLSGRYFSKYINKGVAYKELVNISLLIEKLVGIDKMEYLYSIANLQGLIEELEKYASTREVILLLRKLDKLHTEKYSTSNYFVYRHSKQTYLEIFEMLAKMYANAMYKNGDQILEYYQQFASCLNVKVDDKSRLFFNNEEMEILLKNMGEFYLECKKMGLDCKSNYKPFKKS